MGESPAPRGGAASNPEPERARGRGEHRGAGHPREAQASRPAGKTPSKRVGPYELLSVLGRGGMGIVYRARHVELRHEVALKVVMAPSTEGLARFVREAKLAARLDHPHIARLRDFGKIPSGGAYYTMDRIRGEDLAAVLRKEIPSTRNAAKTLLAVAEAVHHAHRQGIIHRDLKPQNILIDENGVPRVTDFGLAKNVKDEASVEITQSGMVMGTLAYMPPEQVKGAIGELDARTDVYALGAILYHALTGRPPLVADSQLDLMVKIAAMDPIPLQLLNPAVPADLRHICHKCLEKSPSRRYQTARELAADLAAFLSHRPVRARPPSVLRRGWKYAQRNRALLLGTFSVILALSSGLSVALYHWKKARELQTEAEVTAERIERALDKTRALEGLVEQTGGTADSLRGKLQEKEKVLEALTGKAAGAKKAVRRTSMFVARSEARIETLKSRVESLESEAKRITEEKERAIAEANASAARAAWEGERATAAIQAAREAFLRRVKGVEQAGRLEEYLEEAEGLWPAPPEKIRAMEDWLDKVDELRESLDDYRRDLLALHEYRRLADERERGGSDARAEEELAELEARFPESRLWRDDPQELRWQEALLAELVLHLSLLLDPEKGTVASVTKRLERAERIYRESIEESKDDWGRAILSIADRRRCPRYKGLEIPPQLGLVPIGQDPDSRLWEFAHAGTGEPPRRGADGKLIVTEDTGLVLVLIPGGSFRMGALEDQVSYPDERPVHKVTLEPFFLSKYEMTQGQWVRATDPAQDGANPARYDPGTEAAGKRFDLRHPVENVSWEECVDVLSREGLILPTEAQWEYAARAGTRTAWWTGNDERSLEGAANLADQTLKGSLKDSEDDASWVFEEDLDDGYAYHAPVGSFLANAFGLHDVAGNVWEWCRDRYGPYDRPVREGDGERLQTTLEPRIIRGGSWGNPGYRCRSADRHTDSPDDHDEYTGLRPARAISYMDPSQIGSRDERKERRRRSKLERIHRDLDIVEMRLSHFPKSQRLLDTRRRLLRRMAHVIANTAAPETAEEAMNRAREAAAEGPAQDPALAGALAEVYAAAGDSRRAVMTLEESLELRKFGAATSLLPKLEEYRSRLLPDMPSYASIDAAIIAYPASIVPEGASWRFFKGTREPSGGTLGWAEPDFGDGSWKKGPSGFGYEDGDDTTLLDDMKGHYTTLYIRHAFEVADLSDVRRLLLSVRADDGFVAYLNGREVFRVRAGASESPLPFDGVASTFAEEPLSASEKHLDASLLKPGKNILAIQGLNHTKDSSDFSLIPTLLAEPAPGRGLDRERFEEFRSAAKGTDAPDRLAYLEGRLLQRAGRFRDAIGKFEEVLSHDATRPEPHLRRAQCLRSQGAFDAARAGAEEALRLGVEHEQLWDLWFLVSAVDLKQTAEEIAASMAKLATGGGSDSPQADLRWLLESLSKVGAIRINCGGEEYRSVDGMVWGRDRFARFGRRWGPPAGKIPVVRDTRHGPLYWTKRWFPGSAPPDRGYRVPLPVGGYRVTLCFAELGWLEPHKRKFDVVLEGARVLEDYEPGVGRAERVPFELEIEDGHLDIRFSRKLDDPEISAIAVEPLE